MSDVTAGPASEIQREDEISLLALGSAVLRWRRALIGLAVVGAALGFATELSKPREYVSSATFIPQSSQGGPSGLALTASQLGFGIPSGGGGWGPPMYVELVRSRAFLEPIALDTVVVGEDGGRRMALLDLLGIKAPTPERAVTQAVGALNRMITANEEKKLGGVTVSVSTKWPSVSLALANMLVQRVNQFNIETRRSQAKAELQFVEAQTQESEQSLRDAEDRLLAFLQSNRDFGAPRLVFERDRLQREVTRRSQLFTSWLQSREEARIREVRDTPVITVFENPRLAFTPEPRRSARKAILGGIAGAMLGVLFAFIADALSAARRSERHDAREFFRLVEEATPQFLRRMGG